MLILVAEPAYSSAHTAACHRSLECYIKEQKSMKHNDVCLYPRWYLQSLLDHSIGYRMHTVLHCRIIWGGSLASLTFYFLSWTVLPEVALLESVAARPDYTLCHSTAPAVLYSSPHSSSWLWKQQCISLLGHTVRAGRCIKASEAVSDLFGV